MRSKLPYLILVAVGLVIVGIRDLQGHPPDGSGGSPTQAPHQTASTAPSAVTQWQAVGATKVPPPSVQMPGKVTFTVDSLSGSQTPGSFGQAATGLATEMNWLNWSLQNDQPNVLKNFESNSAPYSDLVQALEQSAAAGVGTSLSSNLTISSATLVDLTDADKAYVSHWHQAPSSQAWIVNYKQVVTLSYGTGQTLIINPTWVEGGQVRNDPNMGPIWVDSFRMDCSTVGAGLSMCNQ